MKYDTWTKKHEEEYLAAKKRYETAYANKVKYTREKTVVETKKQQLINSINAKKSELKKVSDTYTDLTKTNGKDNEIDGQIKKSAKHLATAAAQFKNIGTSSRGNQKDLETVFSEKVTKTNKHISDAFSDIEKAKKNLSGRKTALNGEITDSFMETITNGFIDSFKELNQEKPHAKIDYSKFVNFQC